MKRFFKNVGSHIYLFLAWIVLSTIFWGWIFNIVTDTTPAKKITVFIEAESLDDKALAQYLSDDLPDGIKMVKVHPFSYAFFDSETLLSSDVFIVKESNIEKYSGSFYPLGEKFSPGEYYENGDGVLGFKVYDAAEQRGILSDYAVFGDEDCYIFIGAKSPHIEDGFALDTLKKLIEIK